MPKEFPEIILKNDLLFGAITRSSGNAICSCHLLGALTINNVDLKVDFLVKKKLKVPKMGSQKINLSFSISQTFLNKNCHTIFYPIWPYGRIK
jgi:hypothetical protein